jgi:hypothetical protein
MPLLVSPQRASGDPGGPAMTAPKSVASGEVVFDEAAVA